jgi:hypothetical protein
MKLCQEEGTFADADDVPPDSTEYNVLFCQYLSRLQKQHQDLFSSKEDITHYGISRSLRKSAVTRAGKAGLSNSEIGSVNRWQSVEQAKGHCPKHHMQTHYTDVRALAPMTWRYSYVL